MHYDLLEAHGMAEDFTPIFKDAQLLRGVQTR
jgi:hypothetical protein